MTMIVQLDTVIQGIEMAGDGTDIFLNLQTNELEYINDFVLSIEEKEKITNKIDENWNDYKRLSTMYERNDYGIMERFIWKLPEGEMQDELEYAIRGKGAFRMFKSTIYRYGIEEEWYEYKDNAYREMAIQWCKENELEYEE